MSSVFDDLKIAGPAAAMETPQAPAHPRAEPNPEPPCTASGASVKKKPGRPKKAAAKQDCPSATKVTYVSPLVKSKLKKIQAVKMLEDEICPSESDIIDAALVLYVKHNKLNIK